LASITRRTTTKRETAANDALNTPEVVTGTSNLRQRSIKRRESTDNSVLKGGKIRSGEVSASKLTPSEERSTVRHSKKPTSVLETSKKGDTLSRQPKRAAPIISPSIDSAPTSALTASSLGRSSCSSASSSSLATTSRSSALKRETDENDASNASKALKTGAVTRTLRQRPTRMGSVSKSRRESNDYTISSSSRKIAGNASTSKLKSEAAASRRQPILPQPAKSLSTVLASKKPGPRPRQLNVTAATLSAPTPASHLPVSVAPSMNLLSPSVASSTTLALTRSKSCRPSLAELASNTITSSLHTDTSTGKRKLEDEQPMVADAAREDAQRGSKRRRFRHDENNSAKVCVVIDSKPDEGSGSGLVSYSGPKSKGRKIVKNERSSDVGATSVKNMESTSVGSSSVECEGRPVRRAAKRAADSISDYFESNSRRRKTEK
jgi:hypothetical protein